MGAAAAVALALTAAPALAEDRAAAEALFTSARELVSRGDWAAGCPKFEASLALHPSASTMINIAQCHEHGGRVATAWEDYTQALVLNHETAGADRQRALEGIALRGRAALEPRIPRLRIVVTPPSAGLQVKRDGAPLAVAALGEALPADPGPHEVQVTAPGYRPETRAITLTEGSAATLQIALVPAAEGTPPTPPPVRPDAPASGAVPVWAWASGGVGLALTAAGAFFLANDLSAIGALRTNCSTDATGTHCAPGYDYAHDNARKDYSFPLFLVSGGLGLAGITAAIVGIATSQRSSAAAPPPAVSAAPWVGPSGAGAMLRVDF